MKKQCTSLALILCAVIFTGLFSACGSSKSYNTGATSPEAVPQTTATNRMQYSSASASDFGAELSLSQTDSESSGEAIPVTQNQKLIYSVILDIETLDYDTSVKDLETICANYGGYVEYSSVSGNRMNGSSLRWANYTLRIPADKLDEFQSACDDIGNVYNSSRETENSTSTYIDLSARSSALKTEEERLLELLGQADGLDSIITLNSRLSEIRYEIESIESTLRNIDSLVAYSTVYIDLNEVVEEQEAIAVPKTFSERVSAASTLSMRRFTNVMQDVGVFILGEAPLALLTLIIYLFPLLIVLLVVLIILRRKRKNAAPIAQAAEIKAKNNEE